MAKSKTLIKKVLNGEQRGRDQILPANNGAADDVRLLQEIALQVEREKVSGSFDTTCPGEHKSCPGAGKNGARPDTIKRRAPKHNKALKEAEQAALRKPLTPNRYRQLMKEHLEILPLVSRIMDENV